MFPLGCACVASGVIAAAIVGSSPNMAWAERAPGSESPGQQVWDGRCAAGWSQVSSHRNIENTSVALKILEMR